MKQRGDGQSASDVAHPILRQNGCKMGKKSNNKGKKSEFSAVSQPLTVGTKKKGAKQPKMNFAQDGSCRIQHMEYVADVAITNGSQTYSYAVNPQRSEVFTWLTAIATRFEMYKFHSLKFHYKPSCATTTPGYVILGFDFDFYDAAPVKSTILAWKYSAKTVPWAGVSLSVSTDSRLSTFRYNNFTVGSGQDGRLDILGNLWLIVNGAGVSDDLEGGEIYIDYDIEFRQPSYKIPPALYASFQGPDSSGTLTTPFTDLVGNMLLEKVPGDATKFTIKDVGKFIVDFVASGSGQSTRPTMSVAAAAAGAQFLDTAVNNWVDANGTASGLQHLIEVLVPPVYVTTNVTATAGTKTGIWKLATYAATSLTS